MEPQDNFALMLPLIQASFGIVFVLLYRAGVTTAGRWGGAYLAGAAAICAYAIPLDVVTQTLLADVFFLLAYFLFGEALLLRYGVPLRTGMRLGFLAMVCLLDVYIVTVAESMAANLLLIDFSISLLLGIPLLMVVRRMREPIDIAIGILSAISVLNNIVVASIYGLLFPSPQALANFLASDYAYIMQISAAIFGLWYGLAALAAVSLDAQKKYRDAANHDPLTGLLNRRGFESAAATALSGSPRGVVMICDIDRFKSINDDFGHDSGDLVLAGLADILRSLLPERAVIARFGGEEFVVVVPTVSLAEGGALAHSIRLACASHNWHPTGVDRRVTLCVGVSDMIGGADEIAGAINRADTALYAAKDDGRNQVMYMRQGEIAPLSRMVSAA